MMKTPAMPVGIFCLAIALSHRQFAARLHCLECVEKKVQFSGVAAISTISVSSINQAAVSKPAKAIPHLVNTNTFIGFASRCWRFYGLRRGLN